MVTFQNLAGENAAANWTGADADDMIETDKISISSGHSKSYDE